jgi:hypothetical protein
MCAAIVPEGNKNKQKRLELSVPPLRLYSLLIAAFCRRDQSLSHWRETRFLERAMGIEPISQAWDGCDPKSLLFIRGLLPLDGSVHLE